jgi:hypothetical protein
MFFWISLVVLLVYANYGWTTIGPGLAFCLCAMIAESILDLKSQVRLSVDWLGKRVK